jgi:hypothetical protein
MSEKIFVRIGQSRSSDRMEASCHRSLCQSNLRTTFVYADTTISMPKAGLLCCRCVVIITIWIKTRGIFDPSRIRILMSLQLAHY